MDWHTEAVQQIEESCQLSQALKEQAGVLVDIAGRITDALRQGHKVLLLGNGGSSADAQHIAAELSGKFRLEREPLPALALTTNTSCITAIANDYGYEAVFARQLRAIVAPHDVVVCISTSGNSPSVLRAVEEARSHGAFTVALTGDCGELREKADISLCLPSTATPRIQEAHILAGHIICHLVEEALFGGDHE
ncbi:MAG: SIS domain-containing protein [Dehalococcoidia bacterium]